MVLDFVSVLLLWMTWASTTWGRWHKVSGKCHSTVSLCVSCLSLSL